MSYGADGRPVCRTHKALVPEPGQPVDEQARHGSCGSWGGGVAAEVGDGRWVLAQKTGATRGPNVCWGGEYDGVSEGRIAGAELVSMERLRLIAG